MKEKEIFLKVYNEGIAPLQMNAVRGGYAPDGGDDPDGLCIVYKPCTVHCKCVADTAYPCIPICGPIIGKPE